MVQKEKERRASMFGNIKDHKKVLQQVSFSGKLICMDCGSALRRAWNSNNSSKK